MRTTALATPQLVTISPSLAACLPRNVPLGLRMCPVDGDPNLCCVHERILVLQQALGGPKVPKHTKQLPLLLAELCWGRRFGQKMSTSMAVGDSRRNHRGWSPEPPPHLPTHLKKEGAWHKCTASFLMAQSQQLQAVGSLLVPETAPSSAMGVQY